MNLTMKKFEMPKFEVIGLTKDLAFAGASDKGANFEFAPKTTYSAGSDKFTRSEILSSLTEAEENTLKSSI